MSISNGRDTPCTALGRVIYSFAVPETPDIPPERRFVPRSSIIDLFTLNTIQNVLDCRCLSCDEHSRHLDSAKCPRVSAEVIIGKEAPASYILTFALLVYINAPQFIRCILKTSEPTDDACIEANLKDFTEDYLRHNVWPSYDSQHPTQSLELARNFRWRKYNFFVPSWRTDRYEEYDPNTILPFLDEQRLLRTAPGRENEQERGAHGSVFVFKVLPEYISLSECSSGMKLVRKELSSGGTTYTQFRTELKNLDIVKRLKDPHLVKVLKAYKYKDNFNLVFHCAMTNLGAYLREPRYEAHSTTNSTTFANPLWAQLLGIGKALDRIINYTPDMRSPGPPLYGYHFDLKPANILVEDNGTLLISDFGQARFQDVGGTSRITPLGGTEAYAPPEIDSQENKYNRKYDVWSMGCIFLEVCSFVVKGHEGLRTLDAIRTTKTRPNVTDDRFFHICHSTSRYELKPSIQKWMKTLSEADSLPDQKSRAFISEIVALIGQMLDVDVRQRSSSQDLCSTLSGILDRYCSGPACQTPASDRFVLRPGDAECGNEITSHIYSMFYSNGGPWLQSGLKVVEDCEHIITLIIVNDTGVRYEKLGARASTKVIPRYASRGQKDSGVSGYYLHFSLVERNSVALLPAKLYFGEDKDIRETHSILMGQEIKSSRGLAGCTIQDKRSGRAFRGRPASKTGKYTGGDGHMTVQLWSEKSYLDHSRPREESRRSVRQPVFTQPAHRRIVVYLATGILVVRVAKNARIEHRTSSSDPTLLRIVPTDAVRDPSFTASLLSPSHGETTVGIPLSKMELKEEEDKGAFECKSIELRFAAESDLKAVNTMYRKLKEEWRTEFQEIEKFKKRMGEVLGYAPD